MAYLEEALKGRAERNRSLMSDIDYAEKPYRETQQEKELQSKIKTYNSASTKAYEGMKHFDHGTMSNGFNTQLPANALEEYYKWYDNFRSDPWAKKHVFNKYNENNYDFRALYAQQGTWGGNIINPVTGELPATYAKPNHPTFSDASFYSSDYAYGGSFKEDPREHTLVAQYWKDKAGKWIDGVFYSGKELRAKEEQNKSWFQKTFSTESQRRSWADSIVEGGQTEIKDTMLHPNFLSKETKLANKLQQDPVKVAHQQAIKTAIADKGLSFGKALKTGLQTGAAEAAALLFAADYVVRNGSMDIEYDGKSGTAYHELMDYVKQHSLDESQLSKNTLVRGAEKALFWAEKQMPMLLLAGGVGEVADFVGGGIKSMATSIFSREAGVAIAGDALKEKAVQTTFGKIAKGAIRHLDPTNATNLIDIGFALKGSVDDVNQSYAQIRDLERNGIPHDATPEEKATYEHLLKQGKDNLGKYGWMQFGMNYGAMKLVGGQYKTMSHAINPLLEKWGMDSTVKFLSNIYSKQIIKTGVAEGLGASEVAGVAGHMAGEAVKSGVKMGFIQGMPAFLKPYLEEYYLGKPNNGFWENTKEASRAFVDGMFNGMVLHSGMQAIRAGGSLIKGAGVLGNIKALAEQEARFNIGTEVGPRFEQEGASPRSVQAKFTQTGADPFVRDPLSSVRSTPLGQFMDGAQSYFNTQDLLKYFSNRPEMKETAEKLAGSKNTLEDVTQWVEAHKDDPDAGKFVDLVRGLKGETIRAEIKERPSKYTESYKKAYGVLEGLQEGSIFEENYKPTKSSQSLIGEHNAEYAQALEERLNIHQDLSPAQKEYIKSLLLQKYDHIESVQEGINAGHQENDTKVKTQNEETGEEQWLVNQTKVDSANRALTDMQRFGIDQDLYSSLSREEALWNRDSAKDPILYEHSLVKHILNSAQGELEAQKEMIDPKGTQMTDLVDYVKENWGTISGVLSDVHLSDAKKMRGEETFAPDVERPTDPVEAVIHDEMSNQQKTRIEELKKSTEILPNTEKSDVQKVINDHIKNEVKDAIDERANKYSDIYDKVQDAFMWMQKTGEGSSLDESFGIKGYVIGEDGEEMMPGFTISINGEDADTAQTFDEAVSKSVKLLSEQYDEIHSPHIVSEEQEENPLTKPFIPVEQIGPEVVTSDPIYQWEEEGSQSLDTQHVDKLQKDKVVFAKANGYENGEFVGNRSIHNSTLKDIPLNGKIIVQPTPNNGITYSDDQSIASVAMAELMNLPIPDRIAALEEMKTRPADYEHMISYAVMAYEGKGISPIYLSDNNGKVKLTPEELASRAAFVETVIRGGDSVVVTPHRQYLNIDHKAKHSLLSSKTNVKTLQQIPTQIKEGKGGNPMLIFQDKKTLGGNDFGVMIHTKKIGVDTDSVYGKNQSYAIPLANMIIDRVLNGDFTLYPIEYGGAEQSEKYQVKVGEDVPVSKAISLLFNSKKATPEDISMWTSTKTGSIIDKYGKEKNVDFKNIRDQYVHIDYAAKMFYWADATGEHSERITSFNADDIGRRIAERLELRNINLDYANINDKITSSIQIGDLDFRKGRTMADAYMSNNLLHTDVNLEYPTRHSKIYFTANETQTSAGQINTAQSLKDTPIEPISSDIEEQKILPLLEQPTTNQRIAIEEESLPKPDGEPLLIKNGSNLYNIPNSYVYDSIVRSVANTIADDVVNAGGTDLVDLKTMVWDVLKNTEGIPSIDLQKAEDFRLDLLRNIDNTISDVKDIINSDYSDEVITSTIDSMGETLSYVQGGASISPFAKTTKRMEAVLSSLQGKYNTETTVKQIESPDLAKGILMNLLGGKVHSKSDLFKLLSDSTIPLAQEFLRRIQTDNDLATSAYCLFAKQKISYRNISFNENGVSLDKAEEVSHRTTSSRWRREIINMSADKSKMEAAIASYKDLINNQSFNDFNGVSKWLTSLVKTVGIEVEDNLWKMIAESYYNEIGQYDPLLKEEYAQQDNTKALMSSVHHALTNPSYLVSMGFESAGLMGRSNGIASEIASVLKFAKRSNGIVPPTPSLNRLAALNQEFSETPPLYVVNASGKKIYLYQERNFFDRFMSEYLTDRNFVANKLKDPLYKYSHYLQQIESQPEARFKPMELMNYEVPGTNDKKEVATMSAKDLTALRYSIVNRPDNISILQQVSEKDRIVMIQSPFDIPDEYLADPSSYLSQTHVKGEMLSILSSYRNRDLFNASIDPNKSPKDFGLIKGIHWDYKDGKIITEGPGYVSEKFPFLNEMVSLFNGLEGPAMDSRIQQVFKSPEVFNETQKQINQLVSSWVNHLADMGMIHVDKSLSKKGSPGLESILGVQEGFPTDSSTQRQNIALGSEMARGIAKSKVTREEQNKWEDGYSKLLWYIADNDSFASFREKYEIEDQNKDMVREILDEYGFDIPFGIQNLKNTPLIKRFVELYGETPEDKHMPSNETLEAMGGIYNTAIKQLFNSLELDKLIFGDQSLYGSRESQTKRISGIFSTGQQFSQEDNTPIRVLHAKDVFTNESDAFNSMVQQRLGTIEKPSQLLKLKMADSSVSKESIYEREKKKIEDDLKGMKEAMITDGQSFITPKMARKMAIRQGNWNGEQEKAYQLYKSGEKGWENTQLFTVMKCTAWDPQDNNNGLYPKTYNSFYKTAFKPMSIMSEHHNETVFGLVNWAENNDIDIITFDSSVKIGGQEQVKLFQGSDAVDLSNEGLGQHISTVDWGNFRHQLPFVPHPPTNRKVGIQGHKSLLSQSSPNNQQILHDISSKIQSIQTNKMQQDLISRGITSSMVNLKDAVSSSVSLGIMPVENVAKALYGSLLRGTATNLWGNGVVQCSGVGLKTPLLFRDEHNLSESIVNASQLGQVIPTKLSYDVKESIFKKIKEDTGGRIKVLGYRVPTQGLASLEVYNIREICPDTNGDIVFTANALMKQKGHDFDGDKQYQVLPTFMSIVNSDAGGFSINKKLTERFEDMVTKRLNSDDFDEVTHAHTFAIENKSVYQDGKFLSFKGSWSDYLKNITFKYIEGDDSIGGLTNQYIDTAQNILRDPVYSIESTSTVDGPVSHAKSIIKKYSYNPTSYGLEAFGPSYLVKEREIAKSGSETIGSFALNESMKPIIEQLTSGTPSKYVESVIGSFNIWIDNDKLSIIPKISINDRNGIVNRTGGYISDDLIAYTSMAVDASKDPIMAHGNINKHTAGMHAVLLLEGHGDNAQLFMMQPAIREYVKHKDIGTDFPLMEVAKQLCNIIYPGSVDSIRVVKDTMMNANKQMGEFKGEDLQKAALSYKRYQQEEKSMSEWPVAFARQQLGWLMQVPVLEKTATELKKFYVFNQLDKANGSSFADVHNILSSLKNIGPIPQDGKEYYFTKARAFQDVVAQQKVQYPFLLGDNVMKAADSIFENINIPSSSLKNSLHQKLVKQMYAIGFTQNGVDLESLVRGENSLKSQWEKLITSGEMNANEPLYRFIHTGNPKIGDNNKLESLGTVWLDERYITQHNLQNDVTQSIQKAFLSGGDNMRKFLQDWVTFSYVADGGQMPELFPSSVIFSHKLLPDVEQLWAFPDESLSRELAIQTARATSREGIYSNKLPFGAENIKKEGGDIVSFSLKEQESPTMRIVNNNVYVPRSLGENETVEYGLYHPLGETLGTGGFIHYADILDRANTSYEGNFGVQEYSDIPESVEDDNTLDVVHDVLSDDTNKANVPMGVSIGENADFGDAFFSVKTSTKNLIEKTKNILGHEKVVIPEQAKMTKSTWKAIEGLFEDHGIQGKNIAGITTFEYMPSGVVPSIYMNRLSQEERQTLKDYSIHAKEVSKALAKKDIDTLGDKLTEDQKDFLFQVIETKEDLEYASKNLAPVVSLLSVTDQRAFRIVRAMGGDPSAAVDLLMNHIDHPVVQKMINMRTDHLVDDVWLKNLPKQDQQMIVEHLIYC